MVCDRFIDSTVAYQGAARGLGVELVERAQRDRDRRASPDLTLLLRIDRAEARGQQRLAAGERRVGPLRGARASSSSARSPPPTTSSPRRHAERIVVIDAEGAPEEVHERVMAAVEARGA